MRNIVPSLALLVLLSTTLVTCARDAKNPTAAQPVPTNPISTTLEPVQSPAPTSAQALLPTVTPEKPAAEESHSQDWTQMATVVGDRFILGNPAAPVRLVDYSDFL